MSDDDISHCYMNEFLRKFLKRKLHKELLRSKNENLTVEHEKLILLIDAVQDPGNLGTMIRTADAAGFSQIGLR